VSTPYGIRYTKQGSFKITKDGLLVNAQGYPVLSSEPGGLTTAQSVQGAVQSVGQGGPETQGGVTAGQDQMGANAARFINLRDLGRNIHVTEGGDVYAGGNRISKLSVVEFLDPKKLRKNGGVLFENQDPVNFGVGETMTVVRQGVLETSNVNPIQEMTNLIKAHRGFEQDLKAIGTYNEMLGKEVNEVGKL